jgi:hypothetical protein
MDTPLAISWRILLPSARSDRVGIRELHFGAPYWACLYPCQRFDPAVTNDIA